MRPNCTDGKLMRPYRELKQNARWWNCRGFGGLAELMLPVRGKLIGKVTVRPCTDTFGYKALGFTIGEHSSFDPLPTEEGGSDPSDQLNSPARRGRQGAQS
jgi:hypothetical protein